MVFNDLKIGQSFSCNGNNCKKLTSRTALLIKFNKVFYFGKNENVGKKR